MYNNNLDNDINSLNISKKIVKILKENEIIKVYDLWIRNRKYLKNLGLSDNEIKEIIIKLELIGLDLNKKKY